MYYIENNIKEITAINQTINKYHNINPNIKFYPENDKEINKFLDIIKSFGKIDFDEFFNDSKIVDNNKEYIQSLKNWINFNEEIKTKLLYRLSDNGEQFSKFHELCDNKGPTLTLFHVKDGNIVGIYTSLPWDNISGWKGNDLETFIFNLSNNQKYKKISRDSSINCNPKYGPYTACFGCQCECYTMKKIVIYSSSLNDYYENGLEILPNNGQKKYFDLLEVEIFKILKKK